MNRFKEVSKKEFNQFIDSYGKELKTNVHGICEPPIRSFNDFSDNKEWPESMVAKVLLDFIGDDGQEDHDTDQFHKYFILDNEKECEVIEVHTFTASQILGE